MHEIKICFTWFPQKQHQRDIEMRDVVPNPFPATAVSFERAPSQLTTQTSQHQDQSTAQVKKVE